MLYLGFYMLFLSSVDLKVPLNYQLPDYPTGCESVATVNAMSYYKSVDVDDFISRLPKESTYKDGVFHEAFLGDPSSVSGIMCYEEPIEEVVRSYGGFDYVNLTGESFDKVISRVCAGRPVVIWLTNGYVEPRDTSLGYKTPTHTVVISGVDLDSSSLVITDSLYGVVHKDVSEIEDLYYKCGSHAFEVVYKGD